MNIPQKEVEQEIQEANDFYGQGKLEETKQHLNAAITIFDMFYKGIIDIVNTISAKPQGQITSHDIETMENIQKVLNSEEYQNLNRAIAKAYDFMGGIIENDIDASIDMYGCATFYDSKNPIYKNNYGKALVKTFDCFKIDDAIVQFKEALEINPNFEEAKLNLADAYCKLGDIYIENSCPDEDDLNVIIREYENAYKLYPLNEIYSNKLFSTKKQLAIYYEDNEKPEDALIIYNQCLNINPNDGDCYKRIGDIYYLKELYLDAISSYDDAINLDPENAEYHFDLAFTLLKDSQIFENISSITKNLSEYLNKTKSSGNIKLFFDADKHRRAIKEYKKSISLNPNLYRAHLFLCYALYYEALIIFILDFNHPYEDDCDYYQKWKALFNQAMEHSEIFNKIDNIISDPEIRGYKVSHDDVLELIKQTTISYVDTRIEYYNKLLKENSSIKYRNIGFFLKEKGLVDDAIEKLQIATELNPIDAKAHYYLGLSYMEKGYVDDTIEELIIATKNDYSLADAHYYLGLSYVKKHRFDNAIDELTEACKLSDNEDYLDDYFKLKEMIHEEKNDWSNMISDLEHHHQELKSSLQWSYKLNKKDEMLHNPVLRSICAFLNSDGGRLFIGVGDDGEQLGLENDYKTLHTKPNADGFKLYLTSIIENNIGAEYLGDYINIDIKKINGKDICRIDVQKSDKPTFYKYTDKNGPKSAFAVRKINKSENLDIENFYIYITSHFRKYLYKNLS